MNPLASQHINTWLSVYVYVCLSGCESVYVRAHVRVSMTYSQWQFWLRFQLFYALESICPRFLYYVTCQFSSFCYGCCTYQKQICFLFLPFYIVWFFYSLFTEIHINCVLFCFSIYTLKRISLGNLGNSGIYNATKAYKRLWRMTQNKPKWLMQRITQICVLWYTMIYCRMSLYGSSPRYRLESHESNIQAEQHVHIDII